jgi:hypothetical protein
VDFVLGRVPFGDRVSRIDQQVQEDLSEAVLLARDRRYVLEVSGQPRAVADLVPRHVDRRLQHEPQLDRSRIVVVRA